MRRNLVVSVVLSSITSTALGQSSWTPNNDDIYFEGGNVGIGIDTPAFPLTIRTGDEPRVGLFAKNETTVAPSPYDDTFGLWAEAILPKGRGAIGFASATTGPGIGFYGLSFSTAGRGVAGIATATTGNTYGVQGETVSTTGKGVFGLASATTGTAQGVAGLAASPTGVGVYGLASSMSTSDEAIGVLGVSLTIDGIGVMGQADAGGANIGVFGTAPGSGYAVFADGSLASSGSKSFVIDHPSDPENRLLVHYSAEGPDPLLIYRGTVILDDSGSAVVTLPAYFDDIARDPQYALTAVGAPAPSLHIATKVTDGRFTIAGGQQGLEVCWTVTAVRDDPWMRAHAPVAEREKSDREKGTYLRPELYGQPKTKRTFYTTPISPGEAVDPVTPPES